MHAVDHLSRREAELTGWVLHELATANPLIRAVHREVLEGDTLEGSELERVCPEGKRLEAVEGRGFTGAFSVVVGVDKRLNGNDARVTVGDAETEGAGEGGGRGGRR